MHAHKPRCLVAEYESSHAPLHGYRIALVVRKFSVSERKSSAKHCNEIFLQSPV